MMNQNAGFEAVLQGLQTGGAPMGNRAQQPSPATMTPAALSFLSSSGQESPLLRALIQNQAGRWDLPSVLAGALPVQPPAAGFVPVPEIS